jgi:hypothetical protein
VLKNVYDSNNFYQLTGLSFVANRCEYDIECIYLTRNITGITQAQDGKKPTKGPGETGQPPGPIGVSKLGIVDTTIQQENLTKTQHITTDSDGITALKYSDGAGTDYAILAPGLPTSDYSLSLTRTSGAFAHLAPGTTGQVLGLNSGTGRPAWVAGPENGWFNSTTLMKVMPTEFVLNDATDDKWCIEDGTTDKIWGRIYDNRADGVAYAIKAIPTGYKATHVKVWGVNNSGTANPITIREHDHTNGDLVNTTSGNFNASIAITDITSSATANILIKVELSSHRTAGQDIIYGADITIAAV